MHTEDEAKTKWCAFARYVPAREFSFGRIKAAINRWLDAHDTQLNPDPCKCIASECMAWRWLSPEEFFHGPPGRKAETVGYCGLAGEPK